MGHAARPSGRALKLLLIDNYDSFTWILADLLQVAARDEGVALELTVLRNDAEPLAAMLARDPDAVVLSPGPNGPEDAGACLELVRALAGRRPILGVCLGMQVIAQALGGRVVRAPTPVHGKPAWLLHDDQGLFTGLPQPLAAMRYHSLQVDPASLPANLRPTAWLQSEADLPSSQRMPMGLRGPGLEAVQFHPESVGTPNGPAMARAALRWMASKTLESRGKNAPRV